MAPSLESYDVRIDKKARARGQPRVRFTSIPMSKITEIAPVDDGEGWRTCIRRAPISDRQVTYMCKTWNLGFYSQEIYTELYILSHPRLLQGLQGICVPRIICVYENDYEGVDIAMDLPHNRTWQIAHHCIKTKFKQAIVDAFEKIHAQGILHGDVCLKNILIGDDGRITIVNYGKAMCLEGSEYAGISTCGSVAFEEEMRIVKFLIDFEDAREKEYAFQSDITTPLLYGESSSASSTKIYTSKPQVRQRPLSSWDMLQWSNEGDEVLDNPYFEVPPDCGAEPSSIIDASWSSTAPTKPVRDCCIVVSEQPFRLRPRYRKHVYGDHPYEPRRKSRARGRVTFHPDTDDNGIWASGRRPAQIVRTSTPFAFDDGDPISAVNAYIESLLGGSAPVVEDPTDDTTSLYDPSPSQSFIPARNEQQSGRRLSRSCTPFSFEAGYDSGVDADAEPGRSGPSSPPAQPILDSTDNTAPSLFGSHPSKSPIPERQSGRRLSRGPIPSPADPVPDATLNHTHASPLSPSPASSFTPNSVILVDNEGQPEAWRLSPYLFVQMKRLIGAKLPEAERINMKAIDTASENNRHKSPLTIAITEPGSPVSLGKRRAELVDDNEEFERPAKRIC